jgi:hypothetical protein
MNVRDVVHEWVYWEALEILRVEILLGTRLEVAVHKAEGAEEQVLLLWRVYRHHCSPPNPTTSPHPATPTTPAVHTVDPDTMGHLEGGHYKRIHNLGRGTHGSVSLAIDTNTGDRVVRRSICRA